MEAEVSGDALRPVDAPHPPDLRQRQRDRMSPRRPFAKGLQSSATKREPPTAKPKPVAASRSRARGGRAQELVGKRQAQEGLQRAPSTAQHGRDDPDFFKFTITPDGGSAGREGRQFTVAKVGNNGKIFLRPTIRPANQRYPQPTFNFPTTPPSTAGLDSILHLPDTSSTDLDSSTATPLSALKSPSHLDQSLLGSGGDTPRIRPRRSYSHSTIEENLTSIQHSDAGAFKVVIERPDRPKTTTISNGTPTLEVPIPSYKLGTPRFSIRGTAFMRNSSHTLPDDMRSSVFSGYNTPHSGQNSSRPTRILSRRHSDASEMPAIPSLPSPNPYDLASLPSPRMLRRRVQVTPEMFDALTFKPYCDHPSVVRYSRNGAIRAATPARLVAEITSPTFVDYDLLSDFFLTFRTFLETTDLLNMLIARLKWALLRKDEAGTIVRVRTFVAIRHWILNYFLDDFVIDYDLRKAFCDSVNNFVKDAPVNEIQTKIPLKILGELKKCWRRVCALYWDGPDFDTELGPDVQIVPGGVAGSRNPQLDATFWQNRVEPPPRLDGIIEPDFIEPEGVAMSKNVGTYFADVSRAGHLDNTTVRPLTSPDVHNEYDPPLSPRSVMSEDVVSCSFPFRGRHVDGAKPLNAHPVETTAAYESATTSSAAPKTANGQRMRPNHTHKRSGSFSDSFRDHRQQPQPIQKVIYKSTEILLALPYAGSLVRGNLFPPGQAFVDVVLPSTPSDMARTTVGFPGMSEAYKNPSAMSGPGMKKLLGSVRRVLSTKNTPVSNSSPTQGSFPHLPPLGVRGATINRLPGTAVVPQAVPRYAGRRAPMRIDILGAEIAEDFKRAVQEDAEAEAGPHASNLYKDGSASSGSSVHGPNNHYSIMAPEVRTAPLSPAPDRREIMSGVTTGSKSIVIVDDTLSTGVPVMRGALPANDSGDSLTNTYVLASGDPTPPSTPPEASLGIGRRSSHLLGQPLKRRSMSLDNTPSFVTEKHPSNEEESTHHQDLQSTQSTKSRATLQRGKKSISLRRYASYQSGFNTHRSELSFDATTSSEHMDNHNPIVDSNVPPLRVLRRKPAGNLRALNSNEDFDMHTFRRPMSTGSLTTFTDSARSSLLLRHSASYVYVQTDDAQAEPQENQRFSLGALAEPNTKRPVSLFSTHSSQPVMRPSFEKEARFLAQIPDDVDDDGGVESALLKLEGKFEKRQSGTPNLLHSNEDFAGHGNSFGVVPHEMSTLTLADEEEKDDIRKLRHEHAVDMVANKPIPVAMSYRPQPKDLTELQPTVYQPRGIQTRQISPPHDSYESYNSVPLLDRSLTDDEHEDALRDWKDKSVLREASKERLEPRILTPESSHPNSFNFIDDSESLKDAISGVSIDHSFLDDASEVSALSSEMSLEIVPTPEYASQSFVTHDALPGLGITTTITELDVSTHQEPSSPVNPMSNAANNTSDELLPRELRAIHKSDQRLPPSPETTPTARLPPLDGVVSPTFDPLRAHGITEPSRKNSVHLPFILAFDSQVLAQQFTLIEKDALNEIDWKDLIEMRWKDRGNTESRSWVEFLRTSEPHGVEVVIARFNIMVKWAVSELVLTHDLNERVRCIIKYIHIAQQCRKYRNFATMTQITVALTSKDIARLTETWAYVPEAETKILKDLEALISPTSNFHSLRAEMEGFGADQGCIPFVGIYTHDLLINQERPSQIASTPSTDPLTNFDRCRTDAAIVKNLLRLLEASQLYRFQPIEGITERCLWMAALTDEEIHKHSTWIQKI